MNIWNAHHSIYLLFETSLLYLESLISLDTSRHVVYSNGFVSSAHTLSVDVAPSRAPTNSFVNFSINANALGSDKSSSEAATNFPNALYLSVDWCFCGNDDWSCCWACSRWYCICCCCCWCWSCFCWSIRWCLFLWYGVLWLNAACAFRFMWLIFRTPIYPLPWPFCWAVLFRWLKGISFVIFKNGLCRGIYYLTACKWDCWWRCCCSCCFCCCSLSLIGSTSLSVSSTLQSRNIDLLLLVKNKQQKYMNVGNTYRKFAGLTNCSSPCCCVRRFRLSSSL